MVIVYRSLALLLALVLGALGCSSSTTPPAQSTNNASTSTATTGIGTTSGTSCAQTLCNGACVDTQSDSANCGGCGIACTAGTVCSAGMCGCAGGLNQCNGACVNTATDVFNCGGCGMACAGTQACSGGTCACPTGHSSCAEQCVDVQSDVANCGGCAMACVSGQECASGACSCQAGLSNCTGSCLDTNENADNCGGCGTICPTEQVCSLGACADECADGLTQCDRNCANLMTSQANCGTCGNACPAGQTCQAGSCGCPAGQTLCGGQCVDIETSLTHCGACDASCSAGATCVAGSCDCPAGQSFCNGQCVDTTSNAMNCGACGVVCGEGACVDGACPVGKDCASYKTLSGPEFTDFEDYDGSTAANEWGFSFNEPATVYAGPYEYNDETGTPTIAMVAGNGSSYAIEIANPEASAWGAALGFWMGCIDASAYDGVSFWVKGSAPGGEATFSLSMEATTAPGEDDPATGGTCTAEECLGPSSTFPVTTEWSQVLLPWANFEPGSNGVASIPADGTDITGFTFGVNLAWVADPNDETNYIPEPSPYQLTVDDIQFFSAEGSCPSGQVICGGACVDTQTSAAHCGECNNACTAGAVCTAGECACPNGQMLCNDECVDTQTSTSHCGGCGKVCAIGATCSNGTCTGGSGSTSTKCGTTMTLLGNPFQCEFGWGAHDEGSPPSYVDFTSKWVGYEQNIDSQCDGCGWLSSVGNANRIPLYMAYFIAYRANIEAGYGDCNTDFDGQNLCSHGAAFIKANRERLVSIYQSYARRSYQAYSNGPVIWVVEPDMIQYVTSGTQTSPLSFAELGSLMTDIICAIKSEMPNAIIAPNYSPWTSGDDIISFWSALPLDLIDLVHVTGMANVPGGYINDGDANNRSDGTFAYLHGITGKPIIVDTSFGVTTMEDTWSSSPAATLNERIADGVVAANVYPAPGDYQSRINSLNSQLDSTCQ